jgi:hypothetical protein
MKSVIFLNRWNDRFHLMLLKEVGEESHRLDSRYARSLEQAHKAIDYWRTEFEVDPDDIHDNSSVNLNDIFSQMDVDLRDDLEGMPW